MTARPAASPALITGMRAALARLELVTSQLAREAATPRARALARSASQAVVDLDASIAECTGAFCASAGAGSASRIELADVVADLGRRVGPTLEARGIRWSAGRAAPAPVAADAGVTRRLALLLVRAAVARLAGPGRLLFETDSGDAGWSLAVTLERDRATAPPPREGVDELRRFAAAAATGFEHELGSQREVLRCRVVDGEAACAAS
ncbi:MAG: hypothetical protein QNK03_04030 [Myxococcota bacterium]|nr:hypothetical protein [Myxococcota bacterium]